MGYSLAPQIKQRFFDSNGNPLAGGKLYTYQAGTTTPQATYTDSTGATPNANPVILDADGEADVWLNDSLSYKFILKDSSDTTQWTIDNVIGLITNDSVGTASIQDLAVTTAKIANDAVTAAKLADSASVDGDRAVTTDHIRDAAITQAKMAVGATGKWTITSSKTTTYTAAISEIVMVNATSASFTVNFPTAIGVSGQKIRVFRTDQTLANVVTCDFNSTETGDGASTVKIATQYEFYEFTSDGANWVITDHKYPSKFTSYSPTIGATTTPPTEGTGVTKLYTWRREGDSIRIVGVYSQTGAGTAGSGAYLFPLPTGLTLDTAKASVSTAAGGGGGTIVGTGYVSNTTNGTASTYLTRLNMRDTSNLIMHNQETATTAANAFGSASLPLSNTTINFSFNVLIPITNWEG